MMSLIKVLRFIATHPLNQGQRVRAILRYVRWQIGSRLISGAVVYDWVGGSQFLVRAGDTGLTGNIYCGFQEYTEMAYLIHVLRSEDLFVDVGANVGSYTILACAAVGAKGCSIEPVPATYRRLIENVRINHLETSVDCHNIGIGCEAGIIQFSSAMGVGNRALAEGEARDDTISVEVSTLDALLGARMPALIKIDVEGYETAVIEGAHETLRRQTLHSVIMEVNGSGEKYGFDESRIFRTMSEFGFEAYAYSPFDRQLTKVAAGERSPDNTIFIRDVEMVREKLRSAPVFVVQGRRL